MDKIIRIRRTSGIAGGSNYYHHADVICKSIAEALTAAKQGRIHNWRKILEFDSSNINYEKYEYMYPVNDDVSEVPEKPAPQIEQSLLKEAFLNSWCKETAYGLWWPICPSMNQCVPTALITQDFYGGKIICHKMDNGENHFLNKLPNGTEKDFSIDQFKFITPKPLEDEARIRSRSSLLRIKSVADRYAILKERVDRYLKVKYNISK